MIAILKRALPALLLLSLTLLGALPMAAQTDQNSEPNAGEAQAPPQNSGQVPTTDSGINPGSAEEGAAPPSSESRVPTPLPLSIDANMLEFSPELARANFLNLGVSAGASYDSNLLSSNTTPVGGAVYTITPNIGVDMARPRLKLSLNYAGGYLVNQRYSSFNQSNHNASVDLRYRLSPHANFRVSDHFVYTGTFLNQLEGNATGAATGVIQQPNQAVITPVAQQTSNMGTAEITYQYSAGDMIGATGSYYTSHYGNLPAGSAQLIGSTTESGSGFYTHRFTVRNWTGIAYSYQRLNFNPDTQRVQTQSFFLFHTIYLQPRMQLALFAGPELSDLKGQVINTTVTPPVITPTAHQSWSTSGGASFSWQGQRTSIVASGIRKVSDGGGLLEAVRVMTGQGAVRRQLSRTANLAFSGIYSDSRALQTGSSAYTSLKSASGSVAWEQHFGRNFSADLGYARDYQQQSVTTAPTFNVNHNRGWITLAYQFSRPLGQ